MNHALSEFEKLPVLLRAGALSAQDAGALGAMDLLAQVRRCAQDPLSLARITARLLQHYTLCPRHGRKVEDFLVEGVGEAGQKFYWVWPVLYQMASPVGLFTLKADTLEAEALRFVIERNLQGKGFAAACRELRTRPLAVALRAQAEGRTYATVSQFVDTLVERRKAGAPGDNPGLSPAQSDTAQLVALSAAENHRNDTRIGRRRDALVTAATSHVADKGYYSILLDAALDCLLPELCAAA